MSDLEISGTPSAPRTIPAQQLVDAVRANRGGIRIVNAVIEGSVDLDGCTFEHELVIQDTAFRGRLSAEEAHFARSVDLTGCRFEKTPYFDRVTIERNLIAKNLCVEGDFSCANAKVAGEVAFDGAQIKGDLVLYNTEFGANLRCAEGFYATPGSAEAKEAGEVELSTTPPPQIGGEVRLSGARVARAVDCRGAKIARDLDLQNADVGGGLSCGPGLGHRTEIGRVWLLGTKVKGYVDFRGTLVKGDLVLKNAVLDGGLGLGPEEVDAEIRALFPDARDHLTEVGGRIEFGGCFVPDVRDFCAALTHLIRPGAGRAPAVNLEGLQYREVSLPIGPTIGVLNRLEPFPKTTYLSLEKWLRNRGHDDEANEVYLAMKRRQRRSRTFGLALLEWLILDFPIRYGLHSYRLFALYFLPVLILALVLFHTEQAVTPRGSAAAGEAAPGWTLLDDWWLSLQMTFLVPMPTSDAWKPSTRPIPGPVTVLGQTVRYSDFAAVVSLLSWVTVPLFLASVSGLIKRVGSGG
jgi:hypothetical protein